MDVMGLPPLWGGGYGIKAVTEGRWFCRTFYYHELMLTYDGTNYCGFQVQPNGRSVAQTFQDALEAVLGSRPDIKGCSRTDAGVHALGFRLNFHADTRIPPQKLPLALNQHLPPDIRVLAAQTVPEDFPRPVRRPYQDLPVPHP